MQFSVPQFIEVEDKIIGPLTLKQFLIFVFGGLFVFLYWSIFGIGFVFFLLFLPTVGLFVWFALGKFNGLPILTSLPTMVRFFTTPRYRVFRRTGASTLVVKKREAQTAEQQPEREALAPSERMSRLHRLAYILDQKAAEEERLIHRTPHEQNLAQQKIGDFRIKY